jgi:hypothetical protein
VDCSLQIGLEGAEHSGINVKKAHGQYIDVQTLCHDAVEFPHEMYSSLKTQGLQVTVKTSGTKAKAG